MGLKRVNQEFGLIYKTEMYYFNAESDVLNYWFGCDKEIVDAYNNENPDNLIDIDDTVFDYEGNIPPEYDSIYLQEDFIFTFDDGSTSFISLTDNNKFSMDKYYPGENKGEASQFNPFTYFPELKSSQLEPNDLAPLLLAPLPRDKENIDINIVEMKDKIGSFKKPALYAYKKFGMQDNVANFDVSIGNRNINIDIALTGELNVVVPMSIDGESFVNLDDINKVETFNFSLLNSDINEKSSEEIEARYNVYEKIINSNEDFIIEEKSQYPWFYLSINDKDDNPLNDVSDMVNQQFGGYDTIEEAYNVLAQNKNDIVSCIYQKIVDRYNIEKMNEINVKIPVEDIIKHSDSVKNFITPKKVSQNIKINN